MRTKGCGLTYSAPLRRRHRLAPAQRSNRWRSEWNPKEGTDCSILLTRNLAKLRLNFERSARLCLQVIAKRYERSDRSSQQEPLKTSWLDGVHMLRSVLFRPSVRQSKEPAMGQLTFRVLVFYQSVGFIINGHAITNVRSGPLDR